MEAYNLISFTGIFILMGVAWLCSADHKNINWRVVLFGVCLQLLLAIFIFVLPIGARFFMIINDVVVKVLESASAGTRFLFGRLALPPGTSNEMGETSLGFILAFQALPAIVFFAALVNILYFFRIMPLLIRGFSYIFTKLMKISGAESLSTSSNIFVGVESALIIKPYLNEMTRSELCTILTAGMATIASSVMALYVFILHGQFPTIAGHLVSASILSAPAAIVMSKFILPESDIPSTLGINIELPPVNEENFIEAVINGANNGVQLVIGVAALLLAFLGIVSLCDLILGFFGNSLNTWFGLSIDWSIKGLLGYIFYPFTVIIGVPFADALSIAKIIGERVVVTEVQSYQDLAGLLQANALHHNRSAVIAAYALCGFAHIASLAIFVGGIAALAPKRIRELSRLGPRALLAATLACLMTAAIAGTFFNSDSILLQ